MAESIVNVGALVVGGKMKKPPVVPIVNNSPAPITFKLALTPTTPALQQTNALSISTTDNITLEGKGGTCSVIVKLKNSHRIPQFTEEVSSFVVKHFIGRYTLAAHNNISMLE